MKAPLPRLHVYAALYQGVPPGSGLLSRVAPGDVITGSLNSLLASLAAAREVASVSLHLCTAGLEPEVLRSVRNRLATAGVAWSFIELPSCEAGPVAMLRSFYTQARGSGGDLVYFAPYSALYAPELFTQLIEAYSRFKTIFPYREVVITPFDRPEYYTSLFEETLIFKEGGWHMRSVKYSKVAMLFEPGLLRKRWDIFCALALSPIVPEIQEKILWESLGGEAPLMLAPVPTLAVELNDPSPVISLERWWKEYSGFH